MAKKTSTDSPSPKHKVASRKSGTPCATVEHIEFLIGFIQGAKNAAGYGERFVADAQLSPMIVDEESCAAVGRMLRECGKDVIAAHVQTMGPGWYQMYFVFKQEALAEARRLYNAG